MSNEEGWSLVKRLRSETFGGGALELDAADRIEALETALMTAQVGLRVIMAGGAFGRSSEYALEVLEQSMNEEASHADGEVNER